ncbi:MAG: DNA-protecting protein DprA [Armatimonadetes bacterium]|nr:DNA-protecting protein DprA [Armatimonadota bacterium]
MTEIQASSLLGFESLAEFAEVKFYFEGCNASLTQTRIGIVGTRDASAYGKACARAFAEEFAKVGATIISGGAYGIDSAAHEGALSAQGSTIAVTAGGLDRPYPARHSALFKKMEERGGVLTQYPLGVTPAKQNFLERNRVIAALSDVLVVIEAPERSGALSTAVAARQFGRPLFVVPAGINMPSFAGSHSLIRHGAVLCDSPQQVINFLGLEAAQGTSALASSLGEEILNLLKKRSLLPEILAEDLGQDLNDVLSELTLLELDGKVFRDGPTYALSP